MIKNYKLLRIVLLLSFLLSTSCAQIEIVDAEVCGDLGKWGASCHNTLSDNERELMKDDWDKERFGMLCTKAENFTNWKTAIQAMCANKKNNCIFIDKVKQ